jgi:hypothetical protein
VLAAPLATGEHHLDAAGGRGLDQTRGALARGQAARTALDVEHAAALRQQYAHLPALQATHRDLVGADHRATMARGRLAISVRRAERCSVKTSPVKIVVSWTPAFAAAASASPARSCWKGLSRSVSASAMRGASIRLHLMPG